MTDTQQQFLAALRAALCGEPAFRDGESPDFPALFALAGQQKLVPVIYEAVYACPAFAALPEALRKEIRSNAIQRTLQQAQKTAAFTALYSKLRAGGITPAVVKGLACRSLWPKPDQRTSTDEDLLIPPEQFAAVHEALLAEGFTMAPGHAETAFEVSYTRPDGLYFELHKQLFPPDSDVFKAYNAYFRNVFTDLREIPGTDILTLPPNEHLLYLICHALKHFLHSGFGLRQVCDIALYAKAFAGELDFFLLARRCEEIHAARFTAALFAVAGRQLGMSLPELPAAFCLPEGEELPLLEDLLEAGVYGSADLARLHSANMTLSAAEQQGKSGILRSLFPPRALLVSRYPYLKEHPGRLPLAWCSRIAGYLKENRQNGQSAADSLQIARTRTDLLRRYRIIDK